MNHVKTDTAAYSKELNQVIGKVLKSEGLEFT